MRKRRTSASDSKGYPEFCAKAATDDALFCVFRSKISADYGRVLEHFRYEDGKTHLSEIERRNPQLLAMLSEMSGVNEVGKPELHDYSPYGLLAPSTIRYVRHLGDLIEKFGSLDGFDIVEIGGGYGGLCRVTFLAQKPNSYTLIDLPEALRLAARFLQESLPPEDFSRIRFVDGTNLRKPLPSDLAISNCAFSECLPAVQQMYIEHILSKSKRGSLLINLRRESIAPTVLWSRLLAKQPDLSCSVEKPSTNPTNFFLNWGLAETFKTEVTEFPWKAHFRLNRLLGDLAYGMLYRMLFRLKIKKRLSRISNLLGR